MLQQVVADAGLVVVDVAGREDRDLARRALRRRCTGHASDGRGVLAEALRRVGRQRRARPRRRASLSISLRAAGVRVGLVHHLHDDRDRRELAHAVGAREEPVAQARVLPSPNFVRLARAASGAGSRRSTDAAERTGTSSCSRGRTGSTGRRPSRSPPWRRRRPPSSCSRRRGRTASGTRRTGSRSAGSRGRCRRRAPSPRRAPPRRRTRGCASRADAASAPRGCLREGHGDGRQWTRRRRSAR